MSDYIRIQHPDPFGPNGFEGYRYRSQIQYQKLEMELKLLRECYSEVAKHLESIFNRVAQEKTVELLYPDGKKITIGAVPGAVDVQ